MILASSSGPVATVTSGTIPPRTLTPFLRPPSSPWIEWPLGVYHLLTVSLSAEPSSKGMIIWAEPLPNVVSP